MLFLTLITIICCFLIFFIHEAGLYRVYTEREWVDDQGVTNQTLDYHTCWVWKDIYWHARYVCFTGKQQGVTTVTAVKRFHTKYNNIWHFTSEREWSSDGT